MLNLVDAALTVPVAAILATIIAGFAAARTLAGTVAVAALVADARDAGNADVSQLHVYLYVVTFLVVQ